MEENGSEVDCNSSNMEIEGVGQHPHHFYLIG